MKPINPSNIKHPNIYGNIIDTTHYTVSIILGS